MGLSPRKDEMMNRRDFLGGAVGASAAFTAQQSEATKGELRQAQYVIVELMGYKKLAGRLSQGPAGLMQLDVACEGGFVTQFINPQSVYRITIVDEKAVREVAKNIDPLPTIELEIPPRQMRMGYDDYEDEY